MDASISNNNQLAISGEVLKTVINAQENQNYVVLDKQLPPTLENSPLTVEAVNSNNLLKKNVIAIRKGDDLILKYADGSEVVIKDYYLVCSGEAASSCQVLLPDGAGEAISLSPDSVGEPLGISGESLVYASGDSELITGLVNDPSL
ncbi:hypothetical protein ACMAZD_25740 (plasmid) [Vibrio sp. nBUS_14]|uniref:hypothetical protein n=1 Tax=Vibrio sp. nBUS_14 TaxID=3395321 RepID=UPI003EBB6F37